MKILRTTILLTILLFGPAYRSSAYFQYSNLSARQTAAGRNNPVYRNSVASARVNPALAGLAPFAVSASYGNPYSADGLHFSRTAVNIPMREGRGAAGGINLLNLADRYFEKEVSAAGAINLGGSWRAGLGISLYSIYAPGYDGGETFSEYDLAMGLHGGFYKKFKNIEAGFSLINMNSPSFKLSAASQEPYSLPVQASFGAGAFIFEGAWVGGAVYNLEGKLKTTAGVEMSVEDILYLRLSGSPEFINMGTGLKVGRIGFDVSLSSHRRLGPDLGVSIFYGF